MNKNILELKNITHGYGKGEQSVEVIKDLSFSLEAGVICALIGPSGSGKSTLLQLAGLLEKPNKGQIIIEGTDCTNFDDNQISTFRGEKIGFIYQFHRLLPEMTALENVLLPQLFMDVPHDEALKRATDLLEKTGVAHRKNHLPSEMSGGEQQRTAIARALANKPSLLLADEPTGNLDPSLADYIFKEMLEFIHTQGAAALIATHNFELAKMADTKFSLFK